MTLMKVPKCVPWICLTYILSCCPKICFFDVQKVTPLQKKAKNSPFLGTPPTTPLPISSSKTEKLPSTGLQSTCQPSGSVVAVCAFRVLDELATWPAVFVMESFGVRFQKERFGEGGEKNKDTKIQKKMR